MCLTGFTACLATSGKMMGLPYKNLFVGGIEEPLGKRLILVEIIKVDLVIKPKVREMHKCFWLLYKGRGPESCNKAI